MSITDESVCNDALLSLGQETITDLDDTADPQAVKLKSIYSLRLKFLLGRDWVFNRTRATLTKVYKLTIDSAPAPTAAGWIVGDTLTGATSGATCTIKKKVSNTEYWVTEPSADFTDGEVISDGTNSRDCAAGYPIIDKTPPAFGSWLYVFAIPDDYLANLKLVDLDSEEIEYPYLREGFLFYSNVTTAYAKYSMDLTDVSVMPGWFTNLFSMDLADRIAPKLSGNDEKVVSRAKLNRAEAWMDALSGNGKDSYFESAGRETNGNTDSYEGFRCSDL